MTVSSIVPVNTYTGNSFCKKFDFDFLIESGSELIVQLTDEKGITTTLKEGIDYSINEIGNKEGSYIIFPLETSSYDILSENEKITLMLTLVIKQESEFRNSSYFNFNILEWTFDYIIRILQIINRKIERCVKVQEGDNTLPDKLINNLKNYEVNARKWFDFAKEKAEQALEYLQISRAWAIKTDGKVQNEEYSSKYYAEKAEETLKNVENGIKSLGFYQKDGKFYYTDEKGDETPLQFEKTDNLFDLIPKDHILSFEEKEGLELLGEYVYKNSGQGSRYGYPDFYNKCLEEYNAEDNKEEVFGYKNMTINGNLTIKNEVASNFSAENFVEVPAPSGEINSFRIECEFTLPLEITNNIEGVYGQKNTNITSPQLQVVKDNQIFGFNIPVKAETWGYSNYFTIQYKAGSTYKIIYEYKQGNISASIKEDNKDWSVIGTRKSDGIFWSEALCFGKDQDTGIFTGKINLKSIRIEVNGEFYAGAIKTKINKSGHKYYNIEIKNKIDEIYKETGIAWYYGIDTANERILLPRNDWYGANLTEAPVMGNGMAIGFWNGVGGSTAGLVGSINNIGVANISYLNAVKNAYGVKQDTQNRAIINNDCLTGAIGLTQNPQKSGLITKLSLASKEQNYHIYMVVGNTTVKQGKSEISEKNLILYPRRNILFNYVEDPSNGDYAYDLSQYIPSDGLAYAICLGVQANIKNPPNENNMAFDRSITFFDEFKTHQMAFMCSDGGMFPTDNANKSYGVISQNLIIFLPSDSRKFVMTLAGTNNLGWGSLGLSLIWAISC